MAPKKRPRSLTPEHVRERAREILAERANPPSPRVAPADNSPEANRFRDRTVSLIQSLGREGVDAALDSLFEISDLVLNRRYCAQHALNRIVDILNEAHPPSDSEEES